MKERGLTLIDLLVGIALLSIVFLGVFGAYRLGLKVVGQSKNKVTATAIGNAELEKIRNLPYESIGLVGGFPSGTLSATDEFTINNVTYFVEREIDYVVDPADGIAAPEDDCPNDYKKVKIKVSWSGNFGGEISLGTDAAPANLVQECAEPGGVLSVQTFDAYGIAVPSPLIEIRDPDTNVLIESASPDTGQHYFTLLAGTYKVVVSKNGYSSEQTYGGGDVYNSQTIAIPDKPHPIVIDGQLTQSSFSIDRVGSFVVDTLSPWGEDFFSDTFNDQTKISELSNVIVGGGEVVLNSSATDGFLSSATIDASPLSWGEFVFTDSEPVDTGILYRVYYYASSDWVLIPDADLPGNSAGFDASPVDLSGLAPSSYPKLRIRADFSALVAGITPTLYDWQVSWRTSAPTPISSAVFHLQGQKIVGYDAGEQPIYKYSQNHSSGTGSHIDIMGLEWDLYTFSVEPTTGLDLIDIEPSPQPISLLSAANATVKLYLDAENSLLVTIQNDVTLEPVFSAQVRLFNVGLGYDVTQYTNENGQTYFIPLEPATYTLELRAAGYSDASTQVSVSGDNTIVVNMTQLE